MTTTTQSSSRPGAPAHVHTTIDPDTAWQFDLLFEGTGRLCLGSIDGDASIKKGQPGYSPIRSEWYDWPRQRQDILTRVAWHDAQGHDTYVRMCLFTKDSGTKENALPSRIIWRDDEKDQHTPCSALLESSEGNYQVLIKLDRPASTAERQRLMTEWRNAHPGSDDCSADPVHFIRIVGGHNHKRHGAWRVRIAARSERCYYTDRLLARCKGGNTPPPPGAVSQARGEQHNAGDWKQLPNGRRLLDSPRHEAIINGRPQLRRILIEHQRITLNGDDSDSVQVAVVVQNLITSWSDKSPGHLPESEIRADMLTLKPTLRPNISMAQYQVDVDWLIHKYRPANYQPIATRRLGAKRKRGRPVGGLGAQTIATLRAIEAIAPDELGRRILNLDALDAPRRTAQYRIAALRKAGLLITKQIGGNGPLYAILTPKAEGGAQVYSSAVEPPPSAAEPPKTPFRAAPHGETESREEGVYSPNRAREFAPPSDQSSDKEQHHEQHVGRSDEADQPGGRGSRAGSGAAIQSAPTAPGADHTPEGEPTAGRQDTGRGDEATAGATLKPTLAALVRECFDAYPETRLTLSRIVRYVEMNADGRVYDRQVIARIVARERQRRAWARRDAREAERARKLKWASLVRKSQAVASQAASMRRAGDRRAPVWARRAGILAAEETRRIEAGEAPSSRLLPKRGATVEQVLMLTDLEKAPSLDLAADAPPAAPLVLPQIKDDVSDDALCTQQLRAALAAGDSSTALLVLPQIRDDGLWKQLRAQIAIEFDRIRQQQSVGYNA